MSKTIFTGTDWDLETLYTLHDECAIIADEIGLNTYPNQFEIISSSQMLDAYASVGMPINYGHWSFGKKFVTEEQNYRSGRSGLAYELVINSNPCINYLMEENTATTQAVVIAHAGFGHNHFFKNNYMFTEWTSADSIIDYLNFAKAYIAKCEEKYGLREVEKIIDSCHALQMNGVDRYKRPPQISASKERERALEKEAYLQRNVNPLFDTLVEKKKVVHSTRFPEEPEENILKFIEKNSPVLEEWQREIVRIVRMIGQYFFPQRQCLVGQHLVSTNNGLVRLDDLINDDGIVENTDITLLTDGNSYTNTSHTYKTLAETVIVKTKTGRTFQGTPEHPLQILSADNVNFEMAELGNMKVGDKLVYRLDYDIFSNNESLIQYKEYDQEPCVCELCGLESHNISSHLSQAHNVKLSEYSGSAMSDEYRLSRSVNRLVLFPKVFDEGVARLLGYLTAFTVTRNVFSLTFDSLSTAEDCQSLLLSVFGIEVCVDEYFSGYRIHFSSMMLWDWLLLNVPNVKELRRFELPRIVYAFNKDNVRNYLKSFFDVRITYKAFERGSICVSGYSGDYDDLQHLSVILTGFGIIPHISVRERETYESMCNSLGIPNCDDLKAHDYIFRVKSDFCAVYFDEIGTTHKNYKVLKEMNYVYCGKEIFEEVKDVLRDKRKEHCGSSMYRNSSYTHKVTNSLLLKDTGLDIIDMFPRSGEEGILSGNITEDFKTCLFDLGVDDPKLELLKNALRGIESIYADEIVSIEDGNEEYVYDVTVPKNHLFWADGLISHNTKVMNEGYACLIHCHMMDRLHEKGLIDDGTMLEFFHTHSSVVMQPTFDKPYFSGFNPYALGLAMMRDIQRIATEPTKEDEEWFPHIVGRDKWEVIHEAVANFRDESFISQYLSPKVIRDFRMFRLQDDGEYHYQVSSIHDNIGYKDIRRTLSRSYDVSRIDPNIQIYNANLGGSRTLEMHHHSIDGKLLKHEDAMECMRHVKRLWGFDPILVSFDENGKDIDEFIL